MTDDADVPVVPIVFLKVFLVSNGFPLLWAGWSRPGAFTLVFLALVRLAGAPHAERTPEAANAARRRRKFDAL
jgi:hypothetical protein